MQKCKLFIFKDSAICQLHHEIMFKPSPFLPYYKHWKDGSGPGNKARAHSHAAGGGNETPPTKYTECCHLLYPAVWVLEVIAVWPQMSHWQNGIRRGLLCIQNDSDGWEAIVSGKFMTQRSTEHWPEAIQQEQKQTINSGTYRAAS